MRDFVTRHGGLSGTLDALYGRDAETPLAERLARVVREERSDPVRLWALRHLAVEAEPELLLARALEVLGRGDWSLSLGAAEVLRQYPPYDPRGPVPGAASALRELAADAAEQRERRLWAVFALRFLGEEAGDGLAALPELRVPLPARVPERVREAIVRDAALERMRPGTDVRWLIEACDRHAIVGTWDEEDAFEGRITLLHEALQAEGLRHGRARDAAAELHPGPLPWVGSYSLLAVEEHTLRLSALGPFAAPAGALPADLEARVRRAAALAGLTWLESEVLDTGLPGLVVEHYGEVREWTVGEYLHVTAIAEP